MAQWESEVALFGSKAVNLNNINGSKNKLSTIDRTCKNLKFNSSHVEVLIISHNALKSELMSKIEKYSSSFSTLLIADEVHNLGSTGFIENPPDFLILRSVFQQHRYANMMMKVLNFYYSTLVMWFMIFHLIKRLVNALFHLIIMLILLT
ncbi:hypothetical protein ACOBWA_08980 [Psychrobacter sp. ER1]|uniref:hypothetical protein n=1 Tax=Psychrobacter sp. ER1 TaxID=3406645 RepID=UPI003B429429